MPPSARPCGRDPLRRRAWRGFVLLLALAGAGVLPLAGCGHDSVTRPGPVSTDAPPFLGAQPVFSEQPSIGFVDRLELMPDGTLLLHDYYANRVLRFDPAGAPLSAWFTVTDSSNGAPADLQKMRLGRDGLLYFEEALCAAFGDCRRAVVRFSPTGEFRGRLKIFGPDSTQMDGLRDYAVDAGGALYAIDWPNSSEDGARAWRIFKFGPDGTPLLRFGRRGGGDGEFEYLSDLEVASDGTICVSDGSLWRVQRFDGAGRLLNRIADEAVEEYGVGYNDMFATPGGELVLRYGYSGLGRFALDGTLRGTLTLTVPGVYEFGFGNVTLDAAGRVALWDDYHEVLRHFTAGGEQDFELGGRPRAGLDAFTDVEALLPDGGRGAYLVDRNAVKILRVAADGSVTTAWHRRPGAPDADLILRAFATDPAGRLFATEESGREVLELGADGYFHSFCAVPPLLWDQLRSSQFLAVGPERQFYAMNRYSRGGIVSFTASGAIVARWGDSSSPDRPPMSVVGGAVDALGRLWVLDGGGYVYDDPEQPYRRVPASLDAFDPGGRLLARVALDSAAVGLELDPAVLTFDPSGNLVVGGYNRAGGVVATFDTGGRRIGLWGPGLTGDAAFRSPSRLVQDAGGTTFLYDGSTRRLLRFGPAPREGGS